jgi:hypothetical protein
MDAGQKYRQLALEAQERADRSGTESERIAWQNIADLWVVLIADYEEVPKVDAVVYRVSLADPRQ